MKNGNYKSYKNVLRFLVSLALVFFFLGCGGSGGGVSGGPVSDPSAGGKSGTGGSRFLGTLSEDGEPRDGTVRDLVTGNEAQSVNGEYELNGVRIDPQLQAFLLEVIFQDSTSDTFELPFDGTEEVVVTADFRKQGDSIDADFEVNVLGNDPLLGGSNSSANPLKNGEEELLSTDDEVAGNGNHSVSRAPHSSEKQAQEEIDLGTFVEDEEDLDSGGDFNF